MWRLPWVVVSRVILGAPGTDLKRRTADHQNQELLDLTRQILELTKQVHALESARSS
jgi:hypothetical protein